MTTEEMLESLEKRVSTLEYLARVPDPNMKRSQRIIHIVGEYFRINPRMKSNEPRFAIPRQIAMYFCRKNLNMSFPAIGLEFGGMHHTTAMHSCRKIEQEVVSGGKIASDVDKIGRLLSW